MMTAPFASLGGLAFALAVIVTFNGVTSTPAPHEVAHSIGPASAEAKAPRRQRRRGEAAMLADARLVSTAPLLTRRGMRARPVMEATTASFGPGPRLAETLTRRGTRLRPVEETSILAAMR